MRLATVAKGSETWLGLVEGTEIARISDLPGLDGLHSVQELLGAGPEALHQLGRTLHDAGNPRSVAGLRWQSLGDLRLLAPVPRPGKIVAVGLNYRDHAEEQGLELPSAPILFAKFPSSVTGPFDPIILPREKPQVDYEGELAVVIGRRGKRIPQARAMDYVAGYLVFNDVSARAWQFADKQWTRGKSCDTFAPMGPWLTTADQISDPRRLAIRTWLNGTLMQDSSTSNLIFGVPALIAHISEGITLEPGDVIATGTPAGVGIFREPPVLLQPGDVIEVEIDGLGKLSNTVTAES